MKKYQSNNESPKQEQLKNTEILFDTIKIVFKELLQINQQKECKNNTNYTREQDWK